MHVSVDVVNGDEYEVTVDDDGTYGDVLEAVGFGIHEATVLVEGRPVPVDAPIETPSVRALRLVSGG